MQKSVVCPRLVVITMVGNWLVAKQEHQMTYQMLFCTYYVTDQIEYLNSTVSKSMARNNLSHTFTKVK